MANQLTWPTEVIPDADFVFMRAHRMYFREGELLPGVFRDRDGGMSVNWDKYASAEDTKQQAKKLPDENAVIRMPVIGIREILNFKVEHTPEPDNRAHSEVYGLAGDPEQRTEARVKLRRISEVVIPLASRISE